MNDEYVLVKNNVGFYTLSVSDNTKDSIRSSCKLLRRSWILARPQSTLDRRAISDRIRAVNPLVRMRVESQLEEITSDIEVEGILSCLDEISDSVPHVCHFKITHAVQIPSGFHKFCGSFTLQRSNLCISNNILPGLRGYCKEVPVLKFISHTSGRPAKPLQRFQSVK